MTLAEVVEIRCAYCGAPEGVTCKAFREREQGDSVHQVRRNDALTRKRHKARNQNEGPLS